MAKPIVLLNDGGIMARFAYHALAREFNDVQVVCEDRVSRMALLRRRMQRLGPWRVFGQVLFQAGAVPLMTRAAQPRIDEIIRNNALDGHPFPGEVHRVPTVNSPAAQGILRAIQPAVVVVVGTRIIKPATLNAIAAPFINVHTGITPLYRGVHGGYWALAEGHPELAGVTIHLIDAGIDTGNILAQEIIKVTKADTFVTYPYLQMAAALPMLSAAVRSAMNGVVSGSQNPLGLASMLRTHPTFWQYVWLRATRGVR